jgi:hypothetical protein
MRADDYIFESREEVMNRFVTNREGRGNEIKYRIEREKSSGQSPYYSLKIGLTYTKRETDA